MINFKELFCIHKYKMNTKPITSDNISEVECVKCGYKRFKYIDKLNMINTNYIWCECGRDLVNTDAKCEQVKEHVFKYTCNRCSTESYFDFAVCGLFPVQVDKDGDILERND